MNYRQQELTVQDLAQFVAELAQPQANIQELSERPAAMFHIPEVEESKRKDLFIDLLGDELPKVTSKVSVVEDEKEKRRVRRTIIVRGMRGIKQSSLCGCHDMRRR
uniref:Uncharacterized protein n=1 Tax=Solanum tuberosum TaxID=4113 RepID=M1DQK6_SOLTU